MNESRKAFEDYQKIQSNVHPDDKQGMDKAYIKWYESIKYPEQTKKIKDLEDSLDMCKGEHALLLEENREIPKLKTEIYKQQHTWNKEIEQMDYTIVFITNSKRENTIKLNETINKQAKEIEAWKSKHSQDINKANELLAEKNATLDGIRVRLGKRIKHLKAKLKAEKKTWHDCTDLRNELKEFESILKSIEVKE